MTLEQLIAELARVFQKHVDAKVYFRYTDDKLLHGAQPDHITLVTIEEAGKIETRVVITCR